ncbi:2,3-butanediol dehydrogenase [Actinomycetospora sp. NBRC 106378]|uniref:2,3-butanediol dehydrogenase n=1 Tax=Actinomycetospora sp. NBRC 106378 TaxID=3032208 RepID=UPI0024A0D37F|nr:2,3-butanediol dehydrogenase [Actinomycetospora sp. NBRC 106378]GLZ52124.1 alcohol dehydrogenase [Actinomycetospora sp. NBRC 106378]
MKAARFHGRGDVRVEDIPEPHPAPGQVQVAVEWCGICGTDLHEYLDGPIFAPTDAAPHPLTGGAVPITLGHEFSGVIAEVGEGVTGLSEGDRVVVEPYDVCGTCVACRDGRYNICRQLGFIGLDGDQGGFAERMVVDARWAHRIDGLTAEQGALVEPLAVGYHAAKLSGLQQGGTAAVFGSGPIGLVTAAALRATGAGQVIVVEPAEARKAKAPGAGADHVLDPTEVDVPETIRELTGGRGADVTFECAGIDQVLASAVASTRPGGTCVNVSIWGHPATFDVNSLVFSEITLVGSLAYANRHEEVIELIRSGTVDVEQFITGRIALEDIVDRGFRELIDHKESNVKILVHP